MSNATNAAPAEPETNAAPAAARKPAEPEGSALNVELQAIEDEYGAGTIARLLRHVAGQLNLAKNKPLTDEEYRHAFPPVSHPRLYDRDGAILRELAA